MEMCVKVTRINLELLKGNGGSSEDGHEFIDSGSAVVVVKWLVFCGLILQCCL